MLPVSATRRACLVGLVALSTDLACKSTRRDGAQVPMRVVSITPSTTEAVFSLGVGSRVVGRSRYCDYPAEVRAIPAVGGYVDPSLEAVLALRPDLVIGARGPVGRGLVDKLQERGTQCYFPPTESIDEVLAMIRGLAERLAVQPAGVALESDIRHKLASVERAVGDRKRPRTLLVYGLAPIVVAGPKSFPGEMLSRAGCDNVIQEGTGYPIVGLETIIGLDPDLVIDATMAGDAANAPINKDRPGWSGLRAVKTGRVARIDDDRVKRPGPRVAQGVARLAQAAHHGLYLL